MEIWGSARKHGVDDADMRHAVEFAIREIRFDDGMTIFIGTDRAGRLLEVGVGSKNTIVHAMPARDKFLPRR